MDFIPASSPKHVPFSVEERSQLDLLKILGKAGASLKIQGNFIDWALLGIQPDRHCHGLPNNEPDGHHGQRTDQEYETDLVEDRIHHVSSHRIRNVTPACHLCDGTASCIHSFVLGSLLKLMHRDYQGQSRAAQHTAGAPHNQQTTQTMGDLTTQGAPIGCTNQYSGRCGGGHRGCGSARGRRTCRHGGHRSQSAIVSRQDSSATAAFPAR